jgi:hypothetical protein
MRAFAWLASLGLIASARQVITFDSGPLGSTPPNWTVVSPLHGAQARWEIRKDGTAPTQPYVFAQTSSDPDTNRFPLAILNDLKFRDGEVSVRLKPVSGAREQAAGLVWRYRDPRNYYLVRANALEHNIAAYKVVDGRYISLTAQAVRRELPNQGWCILKVSARGSRFSVYVNHRRLMEFQDATFGGPGQVGLWTRADSVVYFDDFRAYAR